MQVVINVCFGGFSLSDAAEDLYASKAGFKVYRYEQTKYKHREGEDEYTRVESGEGGIFSHTYKKDFGEKFSGHPKDDSYWSSRQIDRTDPKLIEVIKELGDSANGGFASLRVVEIPDGIEYEISEYDGSEHIAEVHRTWS